MDFQVAQVPRSIETVHHPAFRREILNFFFDNEGKAVTLQEMPNALSRT